MPIDPTSSPTPEPQPTAREPGRRVLQPFNRALVAPASAATIIAPAVEIAVGLVGTGDQYRIKQMVETAFRMMYDGRCAEGLTIEDLCAEARIGLGHVRDHFADDLILIADVAVRLMHALDNRGVAYEQLTTIGVPCRRSYNGLGADQIRNAAAAIRFMALAPTGSERSATSIDLPLTEGTRDDHTSSRADAARLKHFEDEIGVRPPGTLAEHAGMLLRWHNETRVRTNANRSLFAGRALSAEQFIASGFSDLIVAGPMPSGVPRRRRETAGDVLFPGLQHELIATLEDYKRKAVLYRGPLSGRYDPARSSHGVFELIEPGPSHLEGVLGSADDWGVEWYWSPADERLVRRAVDPVRIEDWRVVGLADDLATAVALISHRLRLWPQACIERAASDSGIGLLQARGVQSHAVLRAILRMANAAMVSAERRARLARG